MSERATADHHRTFSHALSSLMKLGFRSDPARRTCSKIDRPMSVADIVHLLEARIAKGGGDSVWRGEKYIARHHDVTGERSWPSMSPSVLAQNVRESTMGCASVDSFIVDPDENKDRRQHRKEMSKEMRHHVRIASKQPVSATNRCCTGYGGRGKDPTNHCHSGRSTSRSTRKKGESEERYRLERCSFWLVCGAKNKVRR